MILGVHGNSKFLFQDLGSFVKFCVVLADTSVTLANVVTHVLYVLMLCG